MSFQGEEFLRQGLNCPPPKLDAFGSCIVDGSLVDQRWGQCKDKVWCFGLPCWLPLLVPGVLVVLVRLAEHLAVAVDPAADLAAWAAGLAAAAGPLPPVAVAESDCPEAAAVVGVAADLLSLLLAWPLLLLLVLRRLGVWLLWPLLWLRRQRLSWLLLLLVLLLLRSAGILSLCLTVIGFRPCSS